MAKKETKKNTSAAGHCIKRKICKDKGSERNITMVTHAGNQWDTCCCINQNLFSVNNSFQVACFISTPNICQSTYYYKI